MDSSSGWLNNYNFISFGSVESTNDEALSLAKDNITFNHVITAKCQSMGRGSKGSAWVSDSGNLYLSIMLANFPNIPDSTVFPFLMANVISEVMSSYIQDVNNKIELKWPNDILLNQKKVAGILVESISSNNVNYVIIGAGINIKNYPNIEPRKFPPSSLQQEGIFVNDERKFLNQIINLFDEYYTKWLITSDFEPIRNKWLQRAYKIGNEINMQLAGKSLCGIFKDIGPDGRLIMQLSNNDEIVYYSGELT